MLVLLTRQHISRGGRQNLFKTVEKCVHRKVPLPILLGPHFSTTASFASSSDGSSDGKTSKTPAAEQARQRLQEKEEDRLFHSEVERIRAQVIQEMEGSKSTTAMSSNRSKVSCFRLKGQFFSVVLKIRNKLG
jgi:hypothetical protein